MGAQADLNTLTRQQYLFVKEGFLTGAGLFFVFEEYAEPSSLARVPLSIRHCHRAGG